MSKEFRARGDILRIARQAGVGGISFEGIERIFIHAGRPNAAARLEEDLQYLVDKGLLSKTLQRDLFSNVQRWVVQITPRGIDLLDDLIDPEPGVEIVC